MNGSEAVSVEALERVLDYLVIERQRLRSHGGTRLELEANRLAIGAMQYQLARAASRSTTASPRAEPGQRSSTTPRPAARTR
jgi:hypothetical protein